MLADLSLVWLVAVGVAATIAIMLSGIRMTAVADRLADRTGLGEALVGGVLLGAATSLSGTVVSFSAAFDLRASLAFSNAVGGIAAQTAFLALSDVLYRRANLEHAAAELSNVFQCGLLLLMLTLPVIAYTLPEIAILDIHPLSVVLVLAYALGVRATARMRDAPMWRPVDTDETREDTPDPKDSSDKPIGALAWRFAGLMAVLGGAGWVISLVGAEATDRFSLSASAVGALMTAVITSLPELVTTLTAVRRGALQLAVGGIIGGNTFDVLFLTVADAGYRDGSLYHAIERGDLFWLCTGMIMTCILMLGLVMREKSGPGNIGFESVALLVIYAGAVVLQSTVL